MKKNKRFHNLPKQAVSSHFALHFFRQQYSEIKNIDTYRLVFILPKKYVKSAVRRNTIRRIAHHIFSKQADLKRSMSSSSGVFYEQEDAQQKVSREENVLLIRLYKPFDSSTYISAKSRSFKQDIATELALLLNNI